MDSEILGHADHGGQYHLRLGIGLHLAQERHVDLDDVELVILEVVERRVAAAEVIHPDLVAGIAEALDLLAENSGDGAFRDLDVQIGRLYVEFRAAALDLHEHVGELEVKSRQIDRDRLRRLSPVQNRADVRAHLADDVDVEQVNELCPLKDGNEYHGADHAVVGVDPARERLISAALSGERADFPLVERLDVALGEGILEPGDDVVLEVDLTLELDGVKQNLRVIPVGDVLAGGLCLLDEHRGIDAARGEAANAGLYGQLHSACVLLDRFGDL